MALGTKNFEEDLSKQADACRRLGSQLYGKLMSEVRALWLDPKEAEIREIFETAWSERPFSVWYERPLLIALVLHDMALERGKDHPLASAYPSCGGNVAEISPEKIKSAIRLIRESPEHLAYLRQGFVQTNEISRGIVWLWPVAMFASKMGPETLLIDMGASAGLNLTADRLSPIWTDRSGKPLHTSPIPHIRKRIGYDRAPVDVRDAKAVRRLRAAIWADDLARLSRLDQSIFSARELWDSGELSVTKADMLEMPALIRAEVRKTGLPAVIYHTFVTDYLPTHQREEFERMMKDLIVELPAGTLWLEFESARSLYAGKSGSNSGSVMPEIRAHLNIGGLIAQEVLARGAPHPLTLEIEKAGVERLWQQFTI